MNQINQLLDGEYDPSIPSESGMDEVSERIIDPSPIKTQQTLGLLRQRTSGPQQLQLSITDDSDDNPFKEDIMSRFQTGLNRRFSTTQQFKHRSSLSRIMCENEQTSPFRLASLTQGRKKTISEINTSKFAEELLQSNEEMYSRKFKFEKAQFHQCIPNPWEKQQFITVQLAHNMMKQVEDQASIDRMEYDVLKDLKDQKLYQVYVFDPDEAEPATAKIDTTDSIKAYEMKKLKKIKVKETSKYAPQIAIIGYWKLNEMGKFKCYHHFNVPNPVKRTIRKNQASGLGLCSVLNVGREKDVFFFFRGQKNKETKVGFLNLNRKFQNRGSLLNFPVEFEKSIRSTKVEAQRQSFREEIVPRNSFLYHYLKSAYDDKYLMPSPTMVRHSMTQGDSHIVFTSTSILPESLSDKTLIGGETWADRKETVMAGDYNQQEWYADLYIEDLQLLEDLRKAQEAQGDTQPLKSQKNHPKNMLKVHKGKTSAIYFYDIQSQKEVIQIIDGVHFLKSDSGNEPKRTNQIKYLNCKQGAKADQQMISLKTFELPQQDDLEDLFTIGGKDASAGLTSIKLNLSQKGLNQWNSGNKTSNVIEAMLHNDNERVTISARDQCAFTFVLPTEDQTDAQLIFQKLDSTDVKIVKTQGVMTQGKDVYVQANLKTYDTEDDIRAGNGYAKTSVTLYKVSWDINDPNERPPEYKPHFELVQSFARANMIVNNCFVDAAAPIITRDGQIIGAVLFEKPHRNEVTLNWYFTHLEQIDHEQLQYPQEVMKQSYISDYPLLAYKTMSPDNSQIALVHLAQEMPQRIIKLEGEFISFVNNSNENPQEDCKIIFLVGNKGRIKLLMIRLDPWKRIDCEQPFNEPETIFQFNADVILPNRDHECFKPNLFTNDKLKNVMMLQNTINKNCQILLSVQYRHCIMTTSLNTQKFQILISVPEMVKKMQVRGDEDEIFFARNRGDRDTIVKLYLHDQILDKVVITDIFEMDAKLVGFEQSQDYSTMGKVDKNGIMKQISILNSKLKLRTIKQQDGDDFYRVEQETDYSGYELSNLIQSDWSSVILSHKAITDGAIVYKANQDQPGSTNGSKSYFWNAKCHTDNTEAVLKAKFAVKSACRIPFSMTMLAVVEERSQTDQTAKEDFFLVKPTPGTRMQQLNRFDTSMNIQNMVFLNTDHVLVQFRKASVPKKDTQGRVIQAVEEKPEQKENQTVIFDVNGKVINQSQEVFEALQNNLIGESKNVKGSKTLVLRNESNQNTVTLVRFVDGGIGEIVETFTDLEGQVYDDLVGTNADYQQSAEDKGSGLKFAQDIHVTDESELVMIGRVQQEVEREDDVSDEENSLISADNQKTEEEQKKEEKDKQNKKDEKQKKNDLKTPNQIKVHKVLIAPQADKTYSITLIVMIQYYQQRQTKKQKANELLSELQTELVGPYLVYRSTFDDKIHFNQVIENMNDDEQLKVPLYASIRQSSSRKKTLKEVQLNQLIKPKFILDLCMIFTGKNDYKFVSIDMIPRNAFSYVNYCRESDDISQRVQFHQNLFQVTIRNKALIFKLDDDGKGPQEMNYIDNLQQLMEPNTLVNTGTIQACISKQEKKPGHIMNIVKMNRSSSLYFMTNQYSSNVGSLSFENIFRLKKKRLSNNYAGIIFRTCSEVDLLDLAQIKVAIDNKEVLNYIDLDTMLSTYEGHTIFSIHWNDLEVYMQIADQLEAQGFDEEISQKKSYENRDLRRLYRILKTPTMDLKPEISKFFTRVGEYCTQCQSFVAKLRKADKTPTCKHKMQYYVKTIKHMIKKQKKTKPCTSQCRGFKPIAIKSVLYTNEKYRDCLIRVSVLCEETEITTFVNAFDDVKAIFNHHSPTAQLILDKATCTTEYCKQIDVLQLTASKVKIVVKSRRSFINTQYLQNLIKKGDEEFFERQIRRLHNMERIVLGEDRKNISVNVRMLKTNWIFRHRNRGTIKSFKYFLKALVNKDNKNEMLQSDFISTIVEEFWKTHQYGLFFLCFVPFMLLFHATIYFFTICMQSEYGVVFGQTFEEWRDFLQIEIILFSIYFSYFEIKQIIYMGLAYFFMFQNLVEFSSTILNVYLVKLNLEGHTQNEYDDFLEHYDGERSLLLSVAIALMWFRLFKWMRLFPELSYYTRLISETIWDIRYFMILLIMVITTFSNILYILNSQQVAQEGEAYYEFTAWISMYLLGLGEFEQFNFVGRNENYLWVIFICATFIIQITFLNMLIAIMGNTYEKVKDSMKVAKLRERIDILNEYVDVLEIMRPDFNYFFIVRPSNVDEDAEEGWEGGISQLKQAISSNYKKIDKKINQKFKQFELQQAKLNEKSDTQIKIIRRDVVNSKELVEKIAKQQKEGQTAIGQQLAQGQDKIDEKLTRVERLLSGIENAIEPQIEESEQDENSLFSQLSKLK